MDLSPRVEELKRVFRSGRTKSYEWRIKQLQGIVKMTEERESEIEHALFEDMRKPTMEAFVGEIFPVKKSCQVAIKDLKKWMAPTKAPTVSATFPSSATIRPEPLGVVLVISSWNFPFVISLDPIVGAIAAGNAVVLKPSEVAPATAAVISSLLPLYVDNEAICVVEGGVHETTALLEQKWDKIFYTGSSRVGKIVMSAAAKHLTPVILELGGKCPVIIDSTADLKVAAKRIAGGKWGNNNGQACVSPDYILTLDSVAPKLINCLEGTLKEFYGEDPRHSTDMSRIINGTHYTRLSGLLDDPKVKDTIVYGGVQDEGELYISPTILLNPPLDSRIMTEEIFGPLLPIVTVESVEKAIDLVLTLPKPLALYLFTANRDVEEKVIAETSAGGMTVNDVCVHFIQPALPFGGVGESGMGFYHGKHSFDAFSHMKGILHRPFWGDIACRYPPFTKKKQSLIRYLLEADFLSVILTLLGLKKH